ncbi:hypothetical protein Ae201684_012675 [Aphanomyces euteiches]|uniref:Cytochrome P450 n=1 Tax=Aphanomyces euteiches TaxID=100861 RepID=A0A6G0WQW7_9STRA|nr:hypothetical protein Ae201684_012675 [Aphanomyces euteiches]
MLSISVLAQELSWVHLAFLAIAAVSSLFTVRFTARFLYKSYQLRHIPGPKASSLLLGHTLDTLGRAVKWHINGDFPEPFLGWIKQFGDVVLHREMFNHVVVFSDPKAIQHVLVSNARNYPRDPIVSSFISNSVLGHGLLSTEGSVHDGYRKMLNPLFTSQHVKTFVPIYDIKLATSAPKCWLKQQRVAKLSICQMCLASFGFDFQNDLEARDAYHESQLLPDTIFDWPLPSLRRRREAQDKLRQVVNDVIGHKLASSKKGGAQDLLDLILPHSTPEEAIVHTMTFLLAGHETTQSAMTWVFVNVMKYPHVAAQIRQEYREVLARYGSFNTWEAVNELKYTYAVLQETLRLNPVSIRDRRVSAGDDNMPMSDGSQVFVPGGSIIEIYMVAMHRHPKYWANPDAFIPERFLEGTPEWNADLALRGGKSHAYYFLPFSIGSKSCIGLRFSLLEMQLFVAMFVGQFDFKLGQDADTTVSYALATITPVRLTTHVSFAK